MQVCTESQTQLPKQQTYKMSLRKGRGKFQPESKLCNHRCLRLKEVEGFVLHKAMKITKAEAKVLFLMLPNNLTGNLNKSNIVVSFKSI